jgi:hypothetical protein
MKNHAFLIVPFILISFIPCVSAQEDPLAQKKSGETSLKIPDNLFSSKADPESVIRQYAPHATREQIDRALADPNAENRAGLLIGALGGQLTHDQREKLAKEPDLQSDALQQYHWIKQHPKTFTQLEKYRLKHPNASIAELQKAYDLGEIAQVEVSKQTLKGFSKDPANAIRRYAPDASNADIQKAIENLSKQRSTGALHEVFPDLTSGQLLQMLNEPSLSRSAVEARMLSAERPQLAERIDAYRKTHPEATDSQIQKLIESGKISTLEVPEDIMAGIGKKNPDPVKAIKSVMPGASEEKIKMALSAPGFEPEKARWMKIFPTATQDQIDLLLQNPALQTNVVKQYQWEKAHPALTSQIQELKKKNPDATVDELKGQLEKRRLQSVTKNTSKPTPKPKPKVVNKDF